MLEWLLVLIIMIITALAAIYIIGGEQAIAEIGFLLKEILTP